MKTSHCTVDTCIRWNLIFEVYDIYTRVRLDKSRKNVIEVSSRHVITS